MPTRRELSGDGFNHEAITVADTAIGFTHATTQRSDSSHHVIAVVTAENGIMRYRYDGGDPTSTVGHLLSHGDSIVIEGSENVKKFRAIRVGSNNGTLRVTYEAVHG